MQTSPFVHKAHTVFLRGKKNNEEPGRRGRAPLRRSHFRCNYRGLPQLVQLTSPLTILTTFVETWASVPPALFYFSTQLHAVRRNFINERIRY